MKSLFGLACIDTVFGGKIMVDKNKLNYQPIPLPDRVTKSDTEMQLAADSFYADIVRRHTVRDYSSRPVDLAIIETCIKSASLAPSGANQQPWHFVAVSDMKIKRRIREKAEAEERRFYAGGGGNEWIRALEPIGTRPSKPHLEDAPWLIVIFAERYSKFKDGERHKNYYVSESVGIATGFLILALHSVGLVSLTHTPNPMKFLTKLLGRPSSNKPAMILTVGHPAKNATIPFAAKIKKSLNEIMTLYK